MKLKVREIRAGNLCSFCLQNRGCCQCNSCWKTGLWGASSSPVRSTWQHLPPVCWTWLGSAGNSVTTTPGCCRFHEAGNQACVQPSSARPHLLNPSLFVFLTFALTTLSQQSMSHVCPHDSLHTSSLRTSPHPISGLLIKHVTLKSRWQLVKTWRCHDQNTNKSVNQRFSGTSFLVICNSTRSPPFCTHYTHTLLLPQLESW